MIGVGFFKGLFILLIWQIPHYNCLLVTQTSEQSNAINHLENLAYSHTILVIDHTQRWRLSLELFRQVESTERD